MDRVGVGREAEREEGSEGEERGEGKREEGGMEGARRSRASGISLLTTRWQTFPQECEQPYIDLKLGLNKLFSNQS